MKPNRAIALVGSIIVCAINTAVFAEQEWKRPIDSAESHLRELVMHSDGPKEIYALLSEGTWGGIGQRFVLIFDNRAMVRCEDGNGRERERDLSTAELNELKNWISAHKVDGLKQFDEGTADGIQYEYFHLRADGDEHHVFMNNPPRAPIGAGAVFVGGKPSPNRKLYGELTDKMLKLDQAPMRVIYPALEKIPGFRVIHAKEKSAVTSISYQNGQLMAGVMRSDEKPVEWHRVSETGLSDQTEQSQTASSAAEIPGYYNWGKIDAVIPAGPLAGKHLWAGQRQNDNLEALWISSAESKPEMIAPGVFADAVVSPDGEWIVVAKTPPGKMWDVPNGIVRIHLPDKRIFDIDLPPADTFDPIVWVESKKRVLVYRQREIVDWKAGPKEPEFHLVDPTNGSHEKVEGEFRPFFDASKRQLWSTGKPNEFWTALHASVVDPTLEKTTVGKFDSSNFRFTPVLAFPDIYFESSGFFVDQSSKTIWLAINGDLIRLALPE